MRQVGKRRLPVGLTSTPQVAASIPLQSSEELIARESEIEVSSSCIRFRVDLQLKVSLDRHRNDLEQGVRMNVPKSVEHNSRSPECGNEAAPSSRLHSNSGSLMVGPRARRNPGLWGCASIDPERTAQRSCEYRSVYSCRMAPSPLAGRLVECLGAILQLARNI
jgi:hypothetical protein